MVYTEEDGTPGKAVFICEARDQATAQFIAASPMLYEALIMAQAVIGDLVRGGGASIDEIEAYSTVKHALAQAEGKETRP
jgi:hypothetical protein